MSFPLILECITKEMITDSLVKETVVINSQPAWFQQKQVMLNVLFFSVDNISPD